MNFFRSRKENRWGPMARSCANWTRSNKAAVDALRNSLPLYTAHADDPDQQIVRMMLLKLAEHVDATLKGVSSRIELDAKSFDRIAKDGTT